jgi:hypothetical protein
MPSPPYNISSKSTNWFKSCTHLRSLNVHHFGMVEAPAFRVFIPFFVELRVQGKEKGMIKIMTGDDS